MADKTVQITLNASGLPVPSEDPIILEKFKDKLTWCATFDFTISVENYDNLTKENGNADCPFRTKTGTFSTSGKHKYSISANGKVNDPVIDIRP